MADASASTPSHFFRSFSVEDKIFTVEHKGPTIRLTEERNKRKSFALFPFSLGGWLATTVEEAISRPDGFLDKRSSGDLSIFATRKKNTKGVYISLRIISPRIKTGAKFIACPEGNGGLGWLNLADSIRSVAAHAGDNPQAQDPHVSSGSPTDAVQLETTLAHRTRRRRPPRRAQQRVRRNEGVSMFVKITQGTCVMSHIPGLIHKFIRVGEVPSISLSEDPQKFRLQLRSKGDASLLLEIATLQLKSCSLEFLEDIPTPEVIASEPAWSDITTRRVNLWGVPESAMNPDSMAMFLTDFGAYKSMEFLRPNRNGKTGLRVTLDHSDLSLMPQMKYMPLDDEFHAIRIIPVKERGKRTAPTSSPPMLDVPESSTAVERRAGRSNDTSTISDTHVGHVAGQDNQTPTPCPSHSVSHMPSFIPPTTPVPTPPSQSGSLPSNHKTVPTFAQVVRGSSPPTIPRPLVAGSSTPLPRITDLNQAPPSPVSSPEQQTRVEDRLESLVRVGDILGYNEVEKQCMINTAINETSKERLIIVPEREARPSHV